jgi:hypothetical protein
MLFNVLMPYLCKQFFIIVSANAIAALSPFLFAYTIAFLPASVATSHWPNFSPICAFRLYLNGDFALNNIQQLALHSLHLYFLHLFLLLYLPILLILHYVVSGLVIVHFPI